MTGPEHYLPRRGTCCWGAPTARPRRRPGHCECLGRRGPGPCGARPGRRHRHRHIRRGYPRLAKPPGPGSDPAAVIIDALRLVRAW